MLRGCPHRFFHLSVGTKVNRTIYLGELQQRPGPFWSKVTMYDLTLDDSS